MRTPTDDGVPATLTVTTRLTPAQVAELFCALDDEGQADFFEAVGAIGERWAAEARAKGALHLGLDWQLWKAGQHMRDCACVTDRGRDAVRSIYQGMTEAPHG